jgi:hypothetical protein
MEMDKEGLERAAREAAIYIQHVVSLSVYLAVITTYQKRRDDRNRSGKLEQGPSETSSRHCEGSL